MAEISPGAKLFRGGCGSVRRRDFNKFIECWDLVRKSIGLESPRARRRIYTASGDVKHCHFLPEQTSPLLRTLKGPSSQPNLESGSQEHDPLQVQVKESTTISSKFHVTPPSLVDGVPPLAPSLPVKFPNKASAESRMILVLRYRWLGMVPQPAR